MAEAPSDEARPTTVGISHEARASARIAGLKHFETPTLEQVERRRGELLGLIFVLLIALSAAFAYLSSAGPTPELLRDIGGLRVIPPAIIVLAVGFAIYVWEKERHLRRLSRALVNERVLSAALSNRLKEISSLSEAGKAVVSSLELDEVLRVILNAAFDLLEADEGSILLVEGDDLAVAAAIGHAVAYIGDRHKFDSGLAGYVARNREPLLIEGRPDLEEFGASLKPRERSIASAISVPMEAKGELFGVLNLSVLSGDRRFNEYDLRALNLFGEHAAMAIRHARVLRKERDLRSRMAELDRIRAELVGSMTHDLKTPLTTIVGSAKLLLRREAELDAEQRLGALEGIEHQAQRLLGLIDRLLEAARAQAQYSLEPGLLDLVGQIEALVLSFGSAHDRRIVLEKDAERIEAYADPDALDQIVANLLENAVKYSSPETTIWVKIQGADGNVGISVADEGPGIAPEDQEELFEPFRRGPRKRGTGVGLGLFIVCNLVRAMGGDVELRSALGEGSTFTVTLPALPPAPGSEDPADAGREGP